MRFFLLFCLATAIGVPIFHSTGPNLTIEETSQSWTGSESGKVIGTPDG